MVGGIQFQKVQAMSFLQLRLQLFLTGSSFDSWSSASPPPPKLCAELFGGPVVCLVEVLGRGRSDLQMPLRTVRGIHLYLKEKK